VTLGVDDEDVRLAVYGAFATTGAAPTVAQLAERWGAPAEEVRRSLRRLADAHHVVIDGDDAVVMAHPFSSVPMGFSVMGARTLWWGGCAWDSFALPHLLPDEPEVLVATRCPACGAPHALVVGRDAPPRGRQVAHFLVPVARMWDDVVETCGNQRLFCDGACVDAWLAREGHARGDVLDLATLWRLARHWYEGRLARGYTRRDPRTAADHFRQVGLRGEFWGLPDESA
jgi:Alkylmercury lyase